MNLHAGALYCLQRSWHLHVHVISIEMLFSWTKINENKACTINLLRVFILKELNAAEGEVWFRD